VVWGFSFLRSPDHWIATRTGVGGFDSLQQSLLSTDFKLAIQTIQHPFALENCK
jgi:hypothetical protein